MQILRCVGTNWIITLSEKMMQNEKTCVIFYMKSYLKTIAPCFFLSQIKWEQRYGIVWEEGPQLTEGEFLSRFFFYLLFFYFFLFSLPLNPQNIHTCNISTLDIRIMWSTNHNMKRNPKKTNPRSNNSYRENNQQSQINNNLRREWKKDKHKLSDPF